MIDPITLEIFRSRLAAINDEAATTLRLVSGSPVANEAHDMNTALMTPEGEAFAIGVYISIHAMSLASTVQSIVREYADNPGIAEGDIWMSNDPYVGACHQMDVVVVAPIFFNGELVAWTGGTCHQIDLGGPVEGQVQVGAKSIYGEQPLVTPIKFVEKGVVRKDLEWLFLRHSRLQNLAALDLKAMIAACNVATERLQQLIGRYGLETYKDAVSSVIETTEQQFRGRVRDLPDGTFRHRGYIDADGAVYPVVVSMTKEDDHLKFDFTESAPQAPALVNCCRPALEGATISAILPYLCYDVPWCPAGIARAVEIVSKPGTVVHAEWPAGVSKATTTGSYMATISSSVCMSKLLAASEKYRDHVMATWMGGLFVEELFGTDQRGNYFGGTILDAMAGGSGARSYKDGIDTGGFLDSPSSIIANIEDYEFNYPVLCIYRRQQADTGGAGKFRGGATVSMMYMAHDVEKIPTKIMHAIGVEQPGSAGIAGGLPSCTNQFVLKRDSNIRALLGRGTIPQELSEVKGTLEVATGITPTYQGKNDIYHCIGMGGGGYGDPLLRDPDLVLRDVVNGLVTPEWAAKIYGVVVRPNPWRLDRAATLKQRDAVYGQRKKNAEAGRKTKDEGRKTTKDVSPQSGLGRMTNGKGKTSGMKRQTSKAKLAAAKSKKKLVAKAKAKKSSTQGAGEMNTSYSIAVDSGGTFADCIVVDAAGNVTAAKAPSTPDDYSRGVVDSVERAAKQLNLTLDELLSQATLFAHGTTVSTNALLTRSGSKTGLITTLGHEDALIIGRTVQKVAGLTEGEITYLARLDKADPIVPRPLIKGVTERVDYKGVVIVPLNEKDARRAIRELLDEGCGAIAVSLLWSFLDPAHERRIRELIHEEDPDVFVSLSHELAPVIKEYERTATTAINAYLGQVTARYLEALIDRLKAHGLKPEPVIMQSSGGVVPVEQAQERAVSLLSSGPAGGVMGAVALGKALGYNDLITTDVGGTSFDVGLVVEGEPQFSLSPVFAKYHTVLPSIDIPSIGAGGGSIAWIEPGAGLLKVGPRSAGSVPGPVCYDQGGTEPTVTDANVVLNRLNPNFFLGGAKKLHADKARAAIEEKIAKPLGISVEEAALGIIDILDAKMADLVRKVSIGRGYDPRDFVLLAFGGAGPMHVGAYARDVGVKEIIIPAHASEFSAWGIVGSDLMNLRQVSEPMLAPFDPARLNAIYHNLEDEARATLAREGISNGNVSFLRYIDMRYRGQIHEVRVPVTTNELGEQELAKIHQTFEDTYNRKYGQGAAYRKAGIEARTYQVRGIGKIPKPAWVKHEAEPTDASHARKETRQVYFKGGWRATPVYAREHMRTGNRVSGPALVEAVDTTVLVPPDMSLAIDEYGNMVLKSDE